MRIISILNQKGGVGKTTTTINLGAGLTRKNRKVLLIDLDPQGNIATCFNDSSQKDMYDFLIDNADIQECIRNLGTNFDMITCKESLIRAEAQMLGMENKETLLRRKLRGSEHIKNYDYVLIDCPPSIGLLSQNAILASSEIIIPVGCDYLSYKGLRTIVDLINYISDRYDHEIAISKIVPTMYDARNSLCVEILNQMSNDFYELVADPIRVSSKIKESPKFGKSIFKYDLKCTGAEDYMRLVNQVIFDERKYKIEEKKDAADLSDTENAQRHKISLKTPMKSNSKAIRESLGVYTKPSAKTARALKAAAKISKKGKAKTRAKVKTKGGVKVTKFYKIKNNVGRRAAYVGY